MSTQIQLQTILDNLKTAIPELRGVLIASTDGMPIAQNLPTGGDANRMAAMVATALGLGKRISEAFGGGVLNETSVSAQQAQIFVYSAGTKAVLAVISGGSTNVGLIHLESRDSAQKIALILG